MNILIVDSNPDLITSLEKDLSRWGHSLVYANSGTTAWRQLESVPIDMVLAGCLSPDTDGVTFCREIKDWNTENPVYFIYLAENNDEAEIAPIIGAGADDYFVKPIQPGELSSRIQAGARVLELQRQVIHVHDDARKNYFQTITMFNSLIEVFDEALGGHCRRVGKLCRDLAIRHPDVYDVDYQIVESAGLLHDIGMIGLPSGILRKKRTERDENERKLYFTHPTRGQIILDEIEFLRPVGKIVRSHHEQFNGRGFPDGLAGEEIPVLAMILSAASIYDNIIHRGNRLFDQIFQDVERMKGLQLAPSIADLLLEINAENLKEEETKDSIQVSVGNLQVGMMIARDIRMKTGALAMPRDTEVTGYGIAKLKGYGKLECIPKNVYVYKNSVRG